MSQASNSFLEELHRLLSLSFDQEELRTLCFKLSIAYDDLRGEGQTNKVRELIMLVVRHKRLTELVDLAKEERPNTKWPSIPEGVEKKIIGDETKDTTPSAPGSTFNISGDIEAGFVSWGGNQTFNEPIEIDMREIAINQPQGEVVVGDKEDMSGDFQGAIINVSSRLDNVIQTVESLPYGSDSQKEVLRTLIAELQTQLNQVPQDRVDEAQKVAKRIGVLVQEMDAKEPDKEMVQITGESLKRAATNLKDILPTVLTIATQIASHAVQYLS